MTTTNQNNLEKKDSITVVKQSNKSKLNENIDDNSTLTNTLTTLTLDLTNLTTLTYLTTLTLLTTKDKILLQSINPITLSEIQKKLNIPLSTISCAIIHTDKPCLLNDGLIEKVSESPSKYKISKKGVEHLLSLVEAENEKRLEQSLKIEDTRETNKLIEKAKEYLQKHKFQECLDSHKYIEIDCQDVAKFDRFLADSIFEVGEFYNINQCFQIAIEVLSGKSKQILFKNLPKSEYITLGNIGAKHIGRFIAVEGIIQLKSFPRPQIQSMHFECPSCGNIIPMIQINQNLQKPNRCGCGRKGSFKLIHKESVDFQCLRIEELAELLGGKNSTYYFLAYLKGELCSDTWQSYYNPGNRIRLNCIINEEYLEKNKEQSRVGDFILEVVSFETITTPISLKILPSDLEKFQAMRVNSSEIINNFCPNIYNRELVKTAILLSLISGKFNNPFYPYLKRYQSHFYICGDPGLGKSDLLKQTEELFSFVRYVNCESASNVGLTGSCERDDISGSWALKAGALALAHNGVICIDEIDKLNKEHKNALNEPLEQQTITINKAGVHGKLQAVVSAICMGNPQYQYFELNTDLMSQLNLPPALCNRFDGIILLRENKQEVIDRFDKAGKPKYETELLVRYIAYAREIIPQWTIEAWESHKNIIKSDGSFKNRSAEALIRLSSFFAKLYHSKMVLSSHIEMAYNFINDCKKTQKFEENQQTTLIKCN